MMRVFTFVLLGFAAALPASAGMVYEAVTEVESSQSGGDQTMRVTGWVDGDCAKVVFEEADTPAIEEGAYLVTTDGGRTVYLVDPKEETYMAWDMAALMGAAGQVMQGMGGMFEISFRDHEVEKLSSEPGPEILGHPTTHTRYRTSYVLDMKVMGMSQQTATETVQDTWWTTAISDPGFAVWLRGDLPRTGIADLDQVIAAEVEKIEGFPLKSVAVTVAKDKKGQETRTTSTTEVTALREATVPAGTFEIPAGYERIEMPDLGAMTGRQ